MVNLVPELELIVGEQPPVPSSRPRTRNAGSSSCCGDSSGFSLTRTSGWRSFSTICNGSTPRRSDLLEDVFTRSDLRHLMLIGAYRDNEVSAAHPLMLKLETIRNAGTLVQEVKLAPSPMRTWVSSLRMRFAARRARAAPLAELVYEKTAGNPFFMIQFIHALLDEGLLAFDHQVGRWSWDSSASREGLHDQRRGPDGGEANPPAGEDAGGAAAARLSRQQRRHSDARARARNVRRAGPRGPGEAVRLELIERLEGGYRFVHDRIQEAAYSLIPEPLRAGAHLRIGRLLVAHTPRDEREEVIFEIVTSSTAVSR